MQHAFYTNTLKCLITENETAFQCVSACPQECEATYFTGAMTFSQLSSQAVSIILAAHSEDIATDFIDAMELANKLDEFDAIVDCLNRFFNQTNYLMSQIIIFANNSAKFETGLYDFYNTFTVSDDFNMLRNAIGKFLTAYNSAYKENRQKAADFIALNKYQIDNLKILMTSVPNSLNNFFDAYWFYSGISKTLNEIITSTQLARNYLKLTMDAETRTNQSYTPGSFYTDQSNADFCNYQYKELLLSFDKISPVLSYFEQKISKWLQKNLNQIINSTEEKIFASQLEGNKTAGAIPGLWDILEREENTNSTGEYSVWIDLLDTLNKSSSVNMNLCLLQYGESLGRTFNSTLHSAVNIPVWSLNNDIMTLIGDLNDENQLIDKISGFFMTGLITSQSSVAKVKDLSESLSETLMQLVNKIMMSSNDWQNNVVDWQKSVSAQYLSFINSIVSLAQFFPDNFEIQSVVLNMKIWRYHSVKFEGNYWYPDPDWSFAGGVSSNLRSYLSSYGSYWTNYFMNYVTAFDLGYVEQSVAELQALYNEWLHQKDNFSEIINKHSAAFTIDGSFVS